MKLIPLNYESILKELELKSSLILNCNLCNNEYKKSKFKISNYIKRNLTSYCSNECFRLAKNNLSKYNCKTCNKEVLRSSSQIRGNIFCNRSCASSFNGHIFPKRIKKIHFCHTCKINQVKYKIKYCSNECNPKYINYENMTLKELKIKLPDLLRYHSKIRENSRYNYFKFNLNRVCENCNYDKHIEIAHIKSISEFSLETKIGEINNISNLIALCPNCHWEFDNIGSLGRT